MMPLRRSAKLNQNEIYSSKEPFVFLKDVSSRITMNEGVIGFEGGSAVFMDGLLRASGAFDASNPLKPLFEGNIGLDQVRASQFFTAFNQLDQIARLGSFIDGFFDSEATIGLSMDQDLNPLMESLLAEGKFGAKSGALAGMPLQDKLSGLTGLDALNSLSFSEWSHVFNISGEKLHVQSLSFDAGDYTFSVDGSQGFDGSLDYLLKVEMPESAASTLQGAPVGGALQSVSQVANVALVDPSSNRITLDFLAQGSFSDPDVRLNSDMVRSRLTARASALADDARAAAQARIDSLENAARLRAEAELEAQKQNLEDKAKDEAGKLLDGVLDNAGVGANADSLKEKGGEALKGRLKNLLKKKKNN